MAGIKKDELFFHIEYFLLCVKMLKRLDDEIIEEFKKFREKYQKAMFVERRNQMSWITRATGWVRELIPHAVQRYMPGAWCMDRDETIFGIESEKSNTLFDIEEALISGVLSQYGWGDSLKGKKNKYGYIYGDSRLAALLEWKTMNDRNEMPQVGVNQKDQLIKDANKNNVPVYVVYVDLFYLKKKEIYLKVYNLETKEYIGRFNLEEAAKFFRDISNFIYRDKIWKP